MSKTTHKNIVYLYDTLAKISDAGITTKDELRANPILFKEYWCAASCFTDIALKSTTCLNMLNKEFCHLHALNSEDFRSECTIKVFKAFEHIIAHFNKGYHSKSSKNTTCYTFNLFKDFEPVTVHFDENAYFESNDCNLVGYVTQVVQNGLRDVSRKKVISTYSLDDTFDCDDNKSITRLDTTRSYVPSPEEQYISSVGIIEDMEALSEKGPELFGYITKDVGFVPQENATLIDGNKIPINEVFNSQLLMFGEQNNVDVSSYINRYSAPDFKLDKSKASTVDNIYKWTSRGKQKLAIRHPEYVKKKNLKTTF